MIKEYVDVFKRSSVSDGSLISIDVLIHDHIFFSNRFFSFCKWFFIKSYYKIICCNYNKAFFCNEKENSLNAAMSYRTYFHHIRKIS